jgi:hypothetical protein
MSISDVIEDLRAWGDSRIVRHRGHATAFALSCKLSDLGRTDVTGDLPDELKQFWSQVEGADLFVDAKHGQWGLRILSPEQSLAATQRFRDSRARDWVPGDLIVGEFLGDSDLVLVRTSRQSADFGRVLIAMPIDRRDDWFSPAENFASFLGQMVAADGDKYWEVEANPVV